MESDFDSIQDRNAFEQALYNLLSDFLTERELHPTESLLAVHPQSREIRIGVPGEFSEDWECYDLPPFFQDEDGVTEPDCDAIADLAASFFFIR